MGRLRRQARGQASHPTAWRSQRDFPDLARRFSEALVAAKGEVMRADDLQAALDMLGELLREVGARRIVVNGERPLHDLDLAHRFPAYEWHFVERSDGDLRAACAAADVALSSADAALAETGTLVVSSGPTRSRLATLLPPLHVALLPTSRLTTDLFTWIVERAGGTPAGQQEETVTGRLPANLTLISGPSKTADIEQTLSIGVHGPKRLIVILYEGES